MEGALNDIQSAWKPLTFTIMEVALIFRTEVAPFQVDRTIKLGS